MKVGLSEFTDEQINEILMIKQYFKLKKQDNYFFK